MLLCVNGCVCVCVCVRACVQLDRLVSPSVCESVDDPARGICSVRFVFVVVAPQQPTLCARLRYIRLLRERAGFCRSRVFSFDRPLPPAGVIISPAPQRFASGPAGPAGVRSRCRSLLHNISCHLLYISCIYYWPRLSSPLVLCKGT